MGRTVALVLLAGGCFSKPEFTGKDAGTPPACSAYSAWSTPTLVPGASTPNMHAGEPALSPDGSILVFTRFTTNASGLSDGMISSGAVTGVQTIASLDEAGDEAAAWWSADGTKLYYSRVGVGLRVSLVTRGASVTFGAPMMDTEFDPLGGVQRPRFTADGSELYYSASGHDDEIFVATRDAGWSDGHAVAGLEDPNHDERAPCVSGDGRTIVFHSDRESSVFQLFIATRPDRGSPFTMPMRIDELGTAAAQDPELSPDGLTLLFSSYRGQAYANLYMTTRSCL